MGRSTHKKTKMKIPLVKINTQPLDNIAVDTVISRKENWTIGNETIKLENAISKYVGVKYGVACNSGTSALHALMLAYGIKNGDEVIVPSFSFIATSNCALFVGAKPVFADIEDTSLGLDPKDVAKKITEKTKAIIAVHYGGCPCRIEELRQVAKKNNLILIEDACESLGAKSNGLMVGSFGDSAVFSFCQNKVITGGEGGMIATNNRKLADKLRQIIDHGKKNGKFVSLGYNWRMSNITAALILSQFKRIETLIEKRTAIAKRMGGYLPPHTKCVCQLFPIRVHNRDKIQKLLTLAGIGTKVYFEPIHLTPFYKSFGYREGSLPITEQVSKEILNIPIYPDLTGKEVDYIVNSIWRMLNT
jgi:perosamine synthetase